jgi:hypothetical protein
MISRLQECQGCVDYSGIGLYCATFTTAIRCHTVSLAAQARESLEKSGARH